MSNCTMTDEELFEELVWDKLQQGVYVVSDGSVFDYATGEWICNLRIISANK